MRRLIEVTITASCAAMACGWLLFASGLVSPGVLGLSEEQLAYALAGTIGLLLLLGLASGRWGVRRWLLTIGLLALGYAIAADPRLVGLGGYGLGALQGGEWPPRAPIGASVFAAFPLVFAVACGTADRAALLRPSLVQDALRVQGVLAGLLLLVPSVLMTYVLLVERGGHFEVRADLAGLVSSLAARAGSQQALESVIVRAPLALTVIVATASLCVTVRRGFPTTRVSK